MVKKNNPTTLTASVKRQVIQSFIGANNSLHIPQIVHSGAGPVKINMI